MHLFAFRAYSGFWMHEEFDAVKQSSDDKTNLPIRTLIQTTGSADASAPIKSTSHKNQKSTSKSSSSSKKQREKKQPLAELISGKESNSQKNPSKNTSRPSTSKKRRRSDQDFIEEYETIVKDALDKLSNTNTNDVDKLTKKDCCAVLQVCYKVFMKDTKVNKVDDLRSTLRAKIVDDPTVLQDAIQKQQAAAAAAAATTTTSVAMLYADQGYSTQQQQPVAAPRQQQIAAYPIDDSTQDNSPTSSSVATSQLRQQAMAIAAPTNGTDNTNFQLSSHNANTDNDIGFEGAPEDELMVMMAQVENRISNEHILPANNDPSPPSSQWSQVNNNKIYYDEC